MKKLIFIALFAIGFANATQAQCLYGFTDSSGDFTITPTSTWGGTTTFDRELDSRSISFVLYTNTNANYRYVTIDGVQVNSYDSNVSFMYETAYDGGGEVTVDGWVYSYSWMKNYQGILSYLDICMWEE